MQTLKKTKEQQHVLEQFVKYILDPSEQYMVIQGDSGTGKTTLVRMLYDYLVQTKKVYELLQQQSPYNPLDILFTATTNKAAQVLQEKLGQYVVTIHSCLGLRVKPNYQTGTTDLVSTPNRNPISFYYNKILLIEEASFIDPALFEYLQEITLHTNCKIILVGDAYQLAPIKQQVTLMSKIAGTYNCQLTKVLRHKGIISTLGQHCKQAVLSQKLKPLFYDQKDVIYANGDEFKKYVDDIFTHSDYDPHEARILAWTNNQVVNYNNYIRQLHNYPSDFVEGETVITHNPIINREMHYVVDSEVKITTINPLIQIYNIPVYPVKLNHNSQLLYLPADRQMVKQYLKQLAKLKEWKQYFEIKNNWLDLRSAYASTVHKSQGSEYDYVFLDLTDISRCTIASDVARLLYVAVTRAKKKVFLYGGLKESYGGVPILRI